jgi:hypothetical protein
LRHTGTGTYRERQQQLQCSFQHVLPSSFARLGMIQDPERRSGIPACFLFRNESDNSQDLGQTESLTEIPFKTAKSGP